MTNISIAQAGPCVSMRVSVSVRVSHPPPLIASFHACLPRNIQLTSHSATPTRPVHNVNNIPSHSMHTISAAYATYNVSVWYTACLMCKCIASSAALPVMGATRPFLVCVKTLRILVYYDTYYDLNQRHGSSSMGTAREHPNHARRSSAC